MSVRTLCPFLCLYLLSSLSFFITFKCLYQEVRLHVSRPEEILSLKTLAASLKIIGCSLCVYMSLQNKIQNESIPGKLAVC